MKNIKTIMLISVSLLLLLISSCSNHKDITGMSAQDYPIAVGNKWTYQITDELYSYTDTQTITVTKKTIYNLDSILYNTQTISHGVIVDSGTIMFSSNSYSYSSTNAYYSMFYGLRLAFPIAQNSKWVNGGGGYYSDSTKVLYSNQNETVLNNTYSNVYEIKRQQLGLNNSVIALMYVVPKIGVIYQSININFGYPEKIQSIRLISYQLN